MRAQNPLFDARQLSREERRLLPAPFAAAVDFAAVTILRRAHNPYAAYRRITVVRGGRIFWPEAPAEAVTLADRAHLAHELLHVWQYQARRMTGLQILLDRRYRYRLAEGKPFLSYGPEQQAAMVEDFTRRAGGAPPRWTDLSHPPTLYEALFAGIASIGREVISAR